MLNNKSPVNVFGSKNKTTFALRHILGSARGNGILSPSLVAPIDWFCDPCQITGTLRSFLIWKAEMTVCLGYSIVENKWNTVCESTL